MKKDNLAERKTLKTVIILGAITLLYIVYAYQGKPDFYLLFFNRSPIYKDAQAHAQYYQWGVAFFLLGVIPALIVKLGFKEPLKEYGLSILNPLRVLFITLLGIGILTPMIYFGSKNPSIVAVYPLVFNAGDSPTLFLRSSLFYFLYYVGYEFCFRGFLFMGIQDDIGEWQALAVSLITTVLLHVDRSQEEMVLVVLAGVAFPIIVKRLGSLWPAIFIHAYAGIALDYWIVIGKGGFP
jgi:membrane protease YdiL (CAAX protease family)